MNKYKPSEKIKNSQIFHNYQISTKNFDGSTLYEMFLANQRIKTTKICVSEFAVRKGSLSESETVTETKNKKNTQPLNTTSPHLRLQSEKYIHPVNNFFAKQLTMESAKRNQSKNLPIKKTYESMSLQRTQNNKNNLTITLNEKRKKQSSSALKFKLKIVGRKKNKFDVCDFVQSEKFYLNLMQEGKLSGYTASAITVLSGKNKVYTYFGDTIREIASLTKIMSCVVSLFLAKKFQIDIEKEQVRVSRVAGSVPGTTAQLKNGDLITIQDLLFGMMLPSGNDAAYALAEYFSKQILMNQFKDTQNQDSTKEEMKNRYNTSQGNRRANVVSLGKTVLTSPKEFILEMNNFAQHLNMSRTKFNNPHGLSDYQNTSTSNDVAELCYYAMKNQTFRKIVSTKTHELKIYNCHSKLSRKTIWENTNKLLDFQFCSGIKTGITPTAGPCMSAYFCDRNFEAIIVVLNTKNKTSRFQEVFKLFEWARDNVSQ